MGQQYFRTDNQNEIKRKEIISSICNYFSEDKKTKRVYNLYGKSGIGKTYVCKAIYNDDLIVASRNKVLIDFNLIVNNSVPGIIQAIISKFGYGFFQSTQSLLDKYYKSIDSSKSECLEKSLDSLLNEMNHLTEKYGQILLIFDTFEALSSHTVKLCFQRILCETNTDVLFLIAGIRKATYKKNECFFYNLNGFNEDEIKEYLISRNKNMKAVFRKHKKVFLTQIRSFTKDGHPIMCGLLSDMLLHCRDINEQIDYLQNGSSRTARKRLISWISELNSDLLLTMRLTANFNDRMNIRLLTSLSGMSEKRSKECLLELKQFSFVKAFSDDSDPDPQCVLHDIVAELIRDYFPFTQDELALFAEKAIEAYDQMIIDDETRTEDFRLGQSFRVEKVMCLVRNGDFTSAIIMLDNEIIDAIDVFDYGFIDQLMDELESYIPALNKIDESERSKHWEYILEIEKADVELSKYHAQKAFDIYGKLKTEPLYKDEFYKALTEEMFARIVINPCVIEIGKDPSNAADMVRHSIKCIENHKMDRRLVKAYFSLGNAYVRSGQNGKAQLAYDEALSHSKTNIQKAMILLEVSKMLRLQQDVEKALKPLKDCEDLIGSTSKNKGKYHYYKGNVYRDLDQIPEALDFYQLAFKELENGDDDFTLCELNLDYAWLQYIRDDVESVNIEDVQHYLNEGWKYATQYSFGTEYSEYYHILYEVQNYLHEYTTAYDNLDKAIDNAYKYSNIYMILDCLNHRVQRMYHEHQYDSIPSVIEEMENIETRGCKIRVFRGRAMLVQADVLFEREDYESAIQEYFDGFVIVALYGNSRSNVELFEDLFMKGELSMSRCERIKECLNHIPNPEKCRKRLRQSWKRRKISQEYDYFLDCLKNDN